MVHKAFGTLEEKVEQPPLSKKAHLPSLHEDGPKKNGMGDLGSQYCDVSCSHFPPSNSSNPALENKLSTMSRHQKLRLLSGAHYTISIIRSPQNSIGNYPIRSTTGSSGRPSRCRRKPLHRPSEMRWRPEKLWTGTTGALIITYTLLVVPYYKYIV